MNSNKKIRDFCVRSFSCLFNSVLIRTLCSSESYHVEVNWDRESQKQVVKTSYAGIVYDVPWKTNIECLSFQLRVGALAPRNGYCCIYLFEGRVQVT